MAEAGNEAFDVLRFAAALHDLEQGASHDDAVGVFRGSVGVGRARDSEPDTKGPVGEPTDFSDEGPHVRLEF